MNTVEDIVAAWFTLLLGMTGSGAIFTFVFRFIRNSTGGLR